MSLASDDILHSLRSHIDILCRQPRSPHSPGYFESQNYIRRSLKDWGYQTQDHHFHVWGLGQCTNILAENHSFGGKILIGTHYESTPLSGLGADDNASGVAVGLEVAKALRHLSIPIAFVFFDMEEHYFLRSLTGSAQFAKFYAKSIERVLVMDLVGGALTTQFENSYLQFGNAWNQFHHPGLEFMHLPILVLEPLGRLGARSDYDGFRNQNIPFTFISSGTPWYYHTQFDRPEILKFEKMARLVETLVKLISSQFAEPSPIQNTSSSFQNIALEENSTSLLTFLKKFQKHPELNQNYLKKLLNQNGKLSRFQMIRLYSQILPAIKKKKIQ